jgi:hypothetical protein
MSLGHWFSRNWGMATAHISRKGAKELTEKWWQKHDGKVAAAGGATPCGTKDV